MNYSRLYKNLIFSFVFVTTTVVVAQSRQEKRKKESIEQLQKHIKYLASDELEGRQTGSPGEQLSASYIANEFKKNGLTLLGDNGFQKFTMTQFRMASDECVLRINSMPGAGESVPFELNKDFYPLSLTCDYDSCTAEVVDVGYGIVSEKLEKDEYAGAEVEGKIVAMRLGYFGQTENPHSPLANFTDINTKVNTAISKGAIGVILFNNDPNDKAPSGKLNRSVKPTKIPVFYFAKAKPFPRGLTVTMKSKVVAPTAIGHNVVAFKNNHRKKTVIICAHHDHIGYNEYDNSRYRGPQAIHNGADDNASGVAAMIELSKQVQKWGLRKNNYLFIAFSGEELGLLGSKFFTKNPLIAMDKINYVINIDMLGRLDSSKKVLTINGVGTSPLWKEVLSQLENDTALVKVATTESGLGPSDHASFYLEDKPVLHFFSGQHRDYHTPDDDEYKINYEGLYNSIQIIKQMICHTKKKKLTFSKTKDISPGKMRFKVTLGVMPDYSFSGEGMRIDAVTKGRPAEKAGLQRDDIVIQMGDYKVKDMMSYMSALTKFKKGDTVPVTVSRKNGTFTAKVTF